MKEISKKCNDTREKQADRRLIAYAFWKSLVWRGLEQVHVYLFLAYSEWSSSYFIICSLWKGQLFAFCWFVFAFELPPVMSAKVLYVRPFRGKKRFNKVLLLYMPCRFSLSLGQNSQCGKKEESLTCRRFQALGENEASITQGRLLKMILFLLTCRGECRRWVVLRHTRSMSLMW